MQSLATYKHSDCMHANLGRHALHPHHHGGKWQNHERILDQPEVLCHSIPYFSTILSNKAWTPTCHNQTHDPIAKIEKICQQFQRESLQQLLVPRDHDLASLDQSHAATGQTGGHLQRLAEQLSRGRKLAKPQELWSCRLSM